MRRPTKPDRREGGNATLLLHGARPNFAESGLPQTPLDLVLEAGECIHIVTQDWRQAAALSDLCCGLLTPMEGDVRLQGLDWATLPRPEMNALRGRIGRIHHRGAWNGFSRIDHDILMAQRHHTRVPMVALIEAATTLSLAFGLPGLPADSPQRLSEADLARAACVRAFLGSPALLLLDPPMAAAPDILPAFLRSLTAARERGAAAICFSRRGMRWGAYEGAFTQRFALMDTGLVRLRGP